MMSANEFKQVATESLDPRWMKALSLAESGNIDEAANTVIQVLGDVLASKRFLSHVEDIGDIAGYEELIDQLLIEIAIQSLGAISESLEYSSRSMAFMLCKACDAGLVRYASLAANALMDVVSSTADIKLAESYYKIAIATATDPADKAGSLARYAAIVRDGLITGKPDLLTAFELYEQAAGMGMNLAMYHAGFIAKNLNAEEPGPYFDKSAWWFQKLLNRIDNVEPLLSSDPEGAMPRLYNEALYQLAHLHIVDDSVSSDYEYGLRLIKQYEAETDDDFSRQTGLINRALSRRIMALDKPKLNLPANNWHYILTALDWRLDQPLVLPDQPFSIISMARHKAGLYLVVTDFMFDPSRAIELKDALKEHLVAMGITEYFLVPPYALFKENERDIYTVMVHVKNDHVSCVSLSNTKGPLLMIAHSLIGGHFMSPDMASNSCIISIAVNLLNAGERIANGINLNSLYAELDNGWCVPLPVPGIKLPMGMA